MLRIVQPLRVKDLSSSSGLFYFLFLGLELHGSLCRTTLNVERRLTFGNKGLELKFGSKLDLSLNLSLSASFYFSVSYLSSIAPRGQIILSAKSSSIVGSKGLLLKHKPNQI